jgi:hypothetical protein
MADVLRLGFHMVNLRRHHPGETYVLSSDYDALAARLAEAVAFLREIHDHGETPSLNGKVGDWLDALTDSADGGNDGR